MSAWVRGTLLGIAAGLVLVFTTAALLNPYDEQGQPYRMGIHIKLGLQQCAFHWFTGLPCPSCGMTTSFALLMHGDLVNSLKANSVGTILAVVCLAIIPWTLASVIWKRPLFIVSVEAVLLRIVIGFLVLMMFRWVLVVGLIWLNGANS
jgi:hypothetical protein